MQELVRREKSEYIRELGIDRLCILMTGSSSIRDVLLFSYIKNEN